MFHEGLTNCFLLPAPIIFIRQTSGEKYFEPPPEESFGVSVFIAIVFTRMVLLPFIGRQFYTILGLSEVMKSPQLGVFTLSQWNVPTANNAVIMTSIAAEQFPRIGRQLREDVSKCVFWQFLVTPFFLTLNTVAALRLQFPSF